MPADWFLILLRIPFPVALVVAAVILIRRHRSRRATALAAAALIGLALDWLVFSFGGWTVVDHLTDSRSFDTKYQVFSGVQIGQAVWGAACIVLLVCAVVADRRPAPQSGPEADYRDPPN
jgi:hypothetical protein